jgi:RNA polymerase sigma-70 factor (ECF subfamily)
MAVPGRTLLARAQEGDEAAFAAIVEELVPRGYRLASAILQDPHEAEDAVQEALIRAWQKVGQVRESSDSAEPWFLAIVANQCRAMMRRRWWRILKQPEPTDLLQAANGSTDASLDLAAAISRLPQRDRALLMLVYGLDRPISESAAVLGIRSGTARVRLHRALKKLRADLTVEEDEDHG